ncbi:hypothetical protein RISK_003663 [Rhodopirellula islandica]|uniref:Uncharacterized protein n=1 Tax=Rhodopirellula islandica TaxID=595434 RepID=A0A0J1BBR4_RHOIS|nr:hypothetical protein [Rhodopirellula islandica]KLU04077.1 hypothetical protein RISK_003663 [Rhodopirellula islandica]
MLQRLIRRGVLELDSCNLIDGPANASKATTLLSLNATLSS